MKIRWYRSARRHRIGKTSARYVMATTVGRSVTTKEGKPGVEWVGMDERGRVLTVLAELDHDWINVFHVQPDYEGIEPT